MGPRLLPPIQRTQLLRQKLAIASDQFAIEIDRRRRLSWRCCALRSRHCSLTASSRLSVGRSHRPGFQQLRNRLSGFERGKCDQLSRDRPKCEHDLLLPVTSRQWVRYQPQFQRQKCKDEASLTRASAEGKAKGRTRHSAHAFRVVTSDLASAVASGGIRHLCESICRRGDHH